jgi:excisionase family DNA binding protein
MRYYLRRAEMIPATYSKYYNVEEVAEIMRMSERNIQKLCREGKMGSTRTGKSYLIPQESLDEFLKIRR